LASPCTQKRALEIHNCVKNDPTYNELIFQVNVSNWLNTFNVIKSETVTRTKYLQDIVHEKNKMELAQSKGQRFWCPSTIQQFGIL